MRDTACHLLSKQIKDELVNRTNSKVQKCSQNLLFRLVLFADGLLRARGGVRPRRVKVPDAGEELLQRVARRGAEVSWPDLVAGRKAGQGDAGSAHKRRDVMEEGLRLHERQLAEVRGQVERHFARLGELDEPVEEVVRGGHGQLKGQDLEDQMLHPEHLLLRVRVVSDVDKLSDLGRVNLLVFPVNIKLVKM